MEVTMIGHASLFVKTQNCQILMDPVLWDPHQEGLFDIFPSREVLFDRLPSINFLVLSHRHLDHFDIRSLAALPKNVNVIIPKDLFLERYLRQLGYNKITMLKDFSEVKIGPTVLLTTRSENPVPEYGMVFADESGVFWNQVDSVVAPATVRRVLSRFPKIDLLLASWQPMLEANFQINASVSFPHKRYGDTLYNIGLVSPGTLAPGANGFRYTRAATWMNQVVFPVSRERFMEDAKTACPAINSIASLDPGDKFQIHNGISKHEAGVSDFVRRLGDGNRALLDFSPVTAGGPLVDDNPEGVPEQELQATVVHAIEERLATCLHLNSAHFDTNRLWKVIYQLQVVLPSNQLLWNIDFSGNEPRLQRGRNPLANVFTIMTGSSIHALSNGTRGWDYAILGGYCRRFQKLYSAGSHGILAGHEAGIVDPLDMTFPFQECAERFLDNEVKRWSQVPADTLPQDHEALVTIPGGMS
jgi:UDP-MurNAc hydroxylase